MNSTIRQPLTVHNSIDKREQKSTENKSFSFIKQPIQQTIQSTNTTQIIKEQISPQKVIQTVNTKNTCPLQDLETFIKEIDRLQAENQKLKEKTTQPIVINNDQKLLYENQELKNQLEYQKQKNDIQEKSYNDSVRQLDIGWKQDVAQLKYQLEQSEVKHRQALKQEQLKSKDEITKLQSNLTKLSTSDNNNSNLVQAFEMQLIEVKKSNNLLEVQLQQAIQQFDNQSRDQEFTLLKQQTVINSQEQHVNELKTKLTNQREQNQELSKQLNITKDIADNKIKSETKLINDYSNLEKDFQHLTQTYNEHKDILQKKLDELTNLYGKQQEELSQLKIQKEFDNQNIKKLENTIQNETSNHQLEIEGIHKQKQALIQFLQQELVGYKEQNQQLKSVNQKLEKEYKQQQQFYQHNFRELECKTNMLGDECSRLNNIIKQRDEQIFRLQTVQNAQPKSQDIQDLIQIKDGEINLLKQQNESLINDLSRQGENYRNLIQQQKQFQKASEENKLVQISLSEMQTKCEVQEREIERLRVKVLEKSQMLERVQKESLDYQAKLKSKLR